MKSVCLAVFAAALSLVASIANAEMASIYGGRMVSAVVGRLMVSG